MTSRARFCFAFWVMAALSLGGAEPYDVDWFTVDGGGGTSSNGPFSLAGTVAQPDAGVMTGGAFSLEGGFWSFVAALQIPGGPLLSISVSNGFAVVSWPAPTDDWRLEYTAALAPGSVQWTQIPPPYATNNLGIIHHAEPLTPGSRFFRLHKP